MLKNICQNIIGNSGLAGRARVSKLYLCSICLYFTQTNFSLGLASQMYKSEEPHMYLISEGYIPWNKVQ